MAIRTYSIQTLGCKVNQYEGEQLAAALRARGLVPAAAGESADVRVVHTCSVTTQAAGKSRQTVRGAVGGKTNFPLTVLTEKPSAADLVHPRSSAASSRVVVTGCWATSDPAAARALPGVDAVLTHHGDVAAELDALVTRWQNDAVIESTAPEKVDGEIGDQTARSSLADTPDHTGPGRSPWAPGKRAPTGPGTTSLPLLGDHQSGRQRAVMKVQDGCDAHCTYCIIPRLRPTPWSKPVDAAVEEARRLVDAGHVELVLTGIFLGAYGHGTALRRRQGGTKDEGGRMKDEAMRETADPPSSSFRPHPSSFSSTPLASLIHALCTRVPGLLRVRLSSLEPGDLTADLIATLKSHQQVLPHFHLPLQSGSDVLLRRMNRQYGRDDFLRMLDRVQAAFDRPALTTDVIVGFPGETDDEFERTAEVVDRAGFIHVHAFGFSPRPGTAAARWQKDFVRGDVVKQRIEALREAADRHSLAFRRSFVGQDVEVMVELEKSDAPTPASQRHGRCERYFPVWFEDPAAKPGDLVRVRVESVTPGRTHGTRMGATSKGDIDAGA